MGKRGRTKLEPCRFALLSFLFFSEALGAGVLTSVPADLAPHAAHDEGSEDPLQWLTWNVPSACPNRKDLARRIESIIGHAVDAELGFFVVASVTEADTGIHLKMSITHDSEVGVREVTFPNCGEAVDFVSIAVALAIDPDRKSIPSEEPMQQAGPMPAIGPAEGGGSGLALSSEQLTEPTSLPSEAHVSAQPAVEPTPLEKASPSGSSSAQPDSHPDRPQRPTSWFARGGLNFSIGLLPQPGFGPTIGGGRMFGPWALWADTTFLPGGSYEFDQAFSPVGMRWLGGTLGACRFVRLSSLSGGPCMRVQLGGLSGREEVADAGRSPHEGTGVFLGILAGLEGQLALGKHVRAFSSASASLPLVADSFVLSDGTHVYQPGFGFQASLGLLYFF